MLGFVVCLDCKHIVTHRHKERYKTTQPQQRKLPLRTSNNFLKVGGVGVCCWGFCVSLYMSLFHVSSFRHHVIFVWMVVLFICLFSWMGVVVVGFVLLNIICP